MTRPLLLLLLLLISPEDDEEVAVAVESALDAGSDVCLANRFKSYSSK